MKDPLQAEPTPYDILGIGPAATAADIHKAFQAGLVKRQNVQKLTGAKRTLEHPLERALVDLELYDDASLAALDPDPRRDPAALEVARRQATADAWRSQLRRSFPDPAITHSLAVLWTWWAVHETTALSRGEAGNGRIPWDEAWEWAIACWAMTVTSPDFWRMRSSVTPSMVHDVQSAWSERFTADIHHWAQTFRDQGREDVAARFQKLELALTTELRTAKGLLAADVRANRGVLTCGLLMLEKMDLVEKIRTQVEAALARQPDNAGLRSLRDDLSPFAHIAALITSHQPEAALQAIENLPPNKRDSKDVWKLESRAWFERGRQLASLKKTDEALECWRKALGRADTEDEKRLIFDEVVNTCMNVQAAIKDRQREDAIRILEKGLQVVKRSEKLSLALADLVMSRGIETILEAQKKVEREGPSEGIVAEVERGVADLERAAKLGSKRAAEQVEAARSIVEQLKGTAGVPAEVHRFVQAANEAAAKGNWDSAIDNLRQAINQLGSKAPEQIKKNLAIALANRGIAAANRAAEMLTKGSSDQTQLFATVTEHLRGKAGNENECGICGKSRWSNASESWFNFNLPDGGGTATLCAGCAQGIQSVLESKPAPPAEAMRLMRSALNDLREASRLDPTSDYVRSNLNDIEQIASQLEQVAPSAGTPARSTARSAARASIPSYGRSEERNVVHSIIVGAIFLVILCVALAATKDNTKWEWSIRQYQWAMSVRDASLPGLIAIKGSYVIGWPIWAALILTWIWSVPMAYVLGVVCHTRWWKKDAFAKLLEIAVWAWLIVFSAALYHRYAKPSAATVTQQATKAAETAPATTTAPSPEASAPAPSTTSAVTAPAAPAPTTPAPVTPAATTPAPAPAATPGAPAPAATAEPAANAWLTEPAIPPERVAAELERMSGLSNEALTAEIATLQGLALDPASAGAMAAKFLIVTAEEKIGNRATAEAGYEALAVAGGDYGVSAATRITVLDMADPERLDVYYKALLEREPASGWFLAGGVWSHTTTHQAALHELLELRKDKSTIRLFNWLRSKSPFPAPYHYLFVLLGLALAAKVIEIPFEVSTAKVSLITSRFSSQIDRIKTNYAGNPMEMNQNLVEFYKSHGVNPATGCARLAIDIAFVIWVLLALRAWSPQLQLDGARFFWAADIVTRDKGILIAWVVVGLLTIAIQPKVGGSAGAMLFAGLFGLSILAAVAWFMSWPSYVMIFWGLLTVLSTIIHLILVGVLATRA